MDRKASQARTRQSIKHARASLAKKKQRTVAAVFKSSLSDLYVTHPAPFVLTLCLLNPSPIQYSLRKAPAYVLTTVTTRSVLQDERSEVVRAPLHSVC